MDGGREETQKAVDVKAITEGNGCRKDAEMKDLGGSTTETAAHLTAAASCGPAAEGQGAVDAAGGEVAALKQQQGLSDCAAAEAERTDKRGQLSVFGQVVHEYVTMWYIVEVCESTQRGALNGLETGLVGTDGGGGGIGN